MQEISSIHAVQGNATATTTTKQKQRTVSVKSDDYFAATTTSSGSNKHNMKESPIVSSSFPNDIRFELMQKVESSRTSMSSLTTCSTSSSSDSLSSAYHLQNDGPVATLRPVRQVIVSLHFVVLVSVVAVAETVHATVSSFAKCLNLSLIGTFYLGLGLVDLLLDSFGYQNGSQPGKTSKRERATSAVSAFRAATSEASRRKSSLLDSFLLRSSDENRVRTAQFAGSRCVYPDGSPAMVPAGYSQDSVPANYVAAHSNNYNKASKAYSETQEWRKNQRVWNILERPQHYDHDAYPLHIHGRSKDGFPVVYEQPGLVDPSKFIGIGDDGVWDEVEHFLQDRIFLTEFLVNMLPSAVPGFVLVLDLKNVKSGHVTDRDLRLIKARVLEIWNSHYPGMLKRVLVLSTPSWVRASFGKRSDRLGFPVHFCSADRQQYLEDLRDYIADEQIPREFGGSSKKPLGHHAYQLQLQALSRSGPGFSFPSQLRSTRTEVIGPVPSELAGITTVSAEESAVRACQDDKQKNPRGGGRFASVLGVARRCRRTSQRRRRRMAQTVPESKPNAE